MRLLSLFSGIGAFEKALSNLNIPVDLVGFSEIDKYAIGSYCAVHNTPPQLNIGDITKVDERTLPQNIDVLTYGFPCQDISIQGKQVGLIDAAGNKTRSGLLYDALRIIKHTQPKIAISENVKNLLSKRFEQDFGYMLNYFCMADYTNYYAILNSKDYGVPQSRQRVFVVSIRKDVDNGRFEFPKQRCLQRCLMDVCEQSVDNKYYIPAYKIKKIFDKINTIQKPEAGLVQVAHMYNNSSKNGRVYHILGISPTLDTCAGGNSQVIIYNHQDKSFRKLTPKEYWRLQGFSDSDFEKVRVINSDSQLYKQAGNSITVSVAQAIFEKLFEAQLLK